MMRPNAATFHAVLPVLIWALPLGASLIATPGIVHALGPSGYGSYAVAAGLAAFAAVPSANAAVARFTLGGPRLNGSAPFTGIIWVLALFIGLNLAVVVGPAIAFSAALPTLDGEMDLVLLASVGMLMTTASFGQLVLSRLQMRGVWHWGAIVAAGSGIALSLAALATARAGADWTLVLGAQACTAAAGLAALLLIDWVSRPPDPPALAPPPLPEPPLSAIVWFMSRTAASGVIGSAIVLGERLLLGSRFGPAVAGYFALAMTIALLIQAMLNSANVRFPMRFAHAYRHDPEEARRLYRKTVRLTFATAFLGLVGVLACGPAFCAIWLGSEVGGEVARYLPFLATAMAATASVIPTWMALEVAGIERFNLLLMLGIAAAWGLTILLSWSAADPHAVAYARLAGIPVFVGYVVFAERRLFGRPLAGLWLSTASRSLLASSGVAALGLLMPARDWHDLVLLGVLAVLAYAALGLLLGLWHPSDMVETQP